MLCYIEMTENRPMPPEELNFSANWVIPRDRDSPDGAVALSRRAFIDNWFLQKLGDKLNKATDLSVDLSKTYIDRDGTPHWGWTQQPAGGIDYNFKLKPANGISQWEFSHDTRHAPPTTNGTSLEVTGAFCVPLLAPNLFCPFPSSLCVQCRPVRPRYP